MRELQDIAFPRVLVVDDEPTTCQLIRALLEARGYTVSHAWNGEEALRQLQHDLPPGLIIMDLVMPQMDGWVLRAHLRRTPELATIPLIVLTAMDEDPRMLEHLQADAFIQKPFGLSELVQVVQDLCPAGHARPMNLS